MSMEDTDMGSPTPRPNPTSLPHKTSVLFLCRYNSCRSQMAEHFTRALFPSLFIAYSAGLSGEKPVDALAVAVMREEGVDMSQARSKSVEELKDSKLDYVVTVCDASSGECPRFGKAAHTTQVFDDPPTLTASMTSEEEKLAVYRRVARDIRKYVETLPTSLAYA